MFVVQGKLALNSPTLTVNLPQFDQSISQLQNALLILPQSSPLRFIYLSILAVNRLERYKFSDVNEDLDKSISLSAEALLLPFDFQTEDVNVITTFYFLAYALFRRLQKLKQPNDLRYYIKYIRYLRDQLLETSLITRGHITTDLVRSLAAQVELESVDQTRNIKEMATLCRELLTLNVSEGLYLTL